MKTMRWVSASLSVSGCALLVGLSLQACGSSGGNSLFQPGGPKSDGGGPGMGDGATCLLGCNPGTDAGGPPACVGLQCNVNHACSGGAKTSVSGTVYDPAGQQPLYNVVVYVPVDPSGKLAPITPGTNSCNSCDATIGDIVTATLTDEKGNFTLSDIPTGQSIPVVMQIGKWRREIIVPSTADCKDTPLPVTETRLPSKQSEGDLPQMAVLTGGCDQLACLFKRIGIDDSEFTAPTGNGRMHVYQGVGGGDVAGGGAGNCTGPSCPLWTSKADLEKYDIALLSCECGEHNETKPNKQPMHDWITEGGKAFATHFHYTWFKNGPADFSALANWTPGGNDSPPYTIDTAFPKGQAFVKWLANVGALTGTNQIALDPNAVRDSVSTVNQGAQRWIYSPQSNGQGPEHDEYFTFDTPIGGLPPPPGSDAGPSYCGKAVFSDIHVSSTENPKAIIPTECSSRPLTPQEKALEFLFFDLSACVQNDTQPPVPPTPK